MIVEYDQVLLKEWFLPLCFLWKYNFVKMLSLQKRNTLQLVLDWVCIED